MVVAHAFNTSTAGQKQTHLCEFRPGLQIELQDSQDFSEKLCLKGRKKEADPGLQRGLC